jgi:DNA-binding GntR family transcriptional regulator
MLGPNGGPKFQNGPIESAFKRYNQCLQKYKIQNDVSRSYFVHRRRVLAQFDRRASGEPESFRMIRKAASQKSPLSARPLIELEPNMLAQQGLPDRIYSALKHRILTCSLPPGRRLMENDLSREFGVSRTPLREALNRLALEQLVFLTPYRGYAVTPLLLDDIRKLSELRLILESESAALAAERAGKEEVKELKTLARLRYQPGDRATYEQYLRDNSAFHQALVRCTRNARLEAVVASVLDQIQRPLYLGLDTGLNAREATAEHYELVEAVAQRKSQRARKVMADQIKRAEMRILAAVSLANAVER